MIQMLAEILKNYDLQMNSSLFASFFWSLAVKPDVRLFPFRILMPIRNYICLKDLLMSYCYM